MTKNGNFSVAPLIITVEDIDLFAPRLVANTAEGFVEENSPVGTSVTAVTRSSQPLQLRVVDDDLVRLHIKNFQLLAS